MRNKKINTMELLKEHLKSHHNVLVVGPSEYPALDPTALAIVPLLKKGRLTIFDYKAPSIGVKKRTGELGDLHIYKKFFKKIWRGKNVNYVLGEFFSKTPKTVGALPFRNNTFNTIADHYTSEWIVAKTPMKDKKQTLRNIVSEYRRVLKPRGKIILFLRIYKKPNFERELLKQGFSIEKKLINEEKYTIPMGERKLNAKPYYPARYAWIAKKRK